MAETSPGFVENRVSSKQSIFFSVPTETNRNSICFGCFSVCFTKPKNIFSVCFGVLDRYRNNRNKQNFLETNRKNLQKSSLFGGPQNCNFFSRFEPKQTKTQSVSSVFLVCFFAKPKNFFPVCFGLFRCFGPVSKRPKQIELMVWGIKKVDILTNLLLFRLVFCLFRLFQKTKTPCFDTEAKQPKQTSCFG
jgi:hypothetical protein